MIILIIRLILWGNNRIRRHFPVMVSTHLKNMRMSQKFGIIPPKNFWGRNITKHSSESTTYIYICIYIAISGIPYIHVTSRTSFWGHMFFQDKFTSQEKHHKIDLWLHRCFEEEAVGWNTTFFQSSKGSTGISSWRLWHQKTTPVTLKYLKDLSLVFKAGILIYNGKKLGNFHLAE